MDKPQTVTARIAGSERKILLCMWGLILAEKAGYDIASLDIDPSAQAERKGELEQMLEILWIGMLPFNRTLTLEQLGMSISFGDMEAVTAAFTEVLSLQMGEDLKAEVRRQKNRNAKGSPSPNAAKKKRTPKAKPAKPRTAQPREATSA